MSTSYQKTIWFSPRRKIVYESNSENLKNNCYVSFILIYNQKHGRYVQLYHRKNGPTFFYSKDEYYFNNKGIYHRIDGPSSYYFKNRLFYFNGKNLKEQIYWNI